MQSGSTTGRDHKAGFELKGLAHDSRHDRIYESGGDGQFIDLPKTLEYGMSRGINKAIIVGNLGGDPEVKYLPSGAAVANFTVATSEQWKDKQTGEQQSRTEWHRISVFGKLAEICNQYLHKGKQVYIEGKIQTRKWQDKDGNDRYTTEIVANEVQFLGDRSNSTNNGTDIPQDRKVAGKAEPSDNFDDEIPF